jgi:2-polyprenyl-6-methoxyphenol hydroxylase-like FAD-dependent oxidoreductase
VLALERLPDGVRVQTTRGTHDGKILVGADGLHSPVRRLAGLDRKVEGRRRHGARRHFSISPWSEVVEVHLAEDAEAYVTPCGPDRVGVALLWPRQ